MTCDERNIATLDRAKIFWCHGVPWKCWRKATTPWVLWWKIFPFHKHLLIHTLMHSPEQIWYMERVFFCVIWVAYDMIYPFTIHSDGDATDFAGAMLLECLQKWLTCVLDPQWKAVSQRSFLAKVWGICPPCFDKISMFSFQSVISAIFSAFSHLYHTVQLLSCRSRLPTSTSFHLKSCHLEHWTTGPLDHHIQSWYFTGPWYP